MTEREVEVWGALCVMVTGLTVAVTCLRRGDVLNCDAALEGVTEAGQHFTAKLEELIEAEKP
jgi:hypothetical protein